MLSKNDGVKRPKYCLSENLILLKKTDKKNIY